MPDDTQAPVNGPQELPMSDNAAPAKTAAPNPKTKSDVKEKVGKALGQASKSMAAVSADIPKPKSGPEFSPLGEPLGNYKKGTDYVPKTGNDKLHEGEAVIPKEKNEVAGALGESKPKDSKK